MRLEIYIFYYLEIWGCFKLLFTLNRISWIESSESRLIGDIFVLFSKQLNRNIILSLNTRCIACWDLLIWYLLQYNDGCYRLKGSRKYRWHRVVHYIIYIGFSSVCPDCWLDTRTVSRAAREERRNERRQKRDLYHIAKGVSRKLRVRKACTLTEHFIRNTCTTTYSCNYPISQSCGSSA